MLRIAIIGGGASGLICAARLSKLLKKQNQSVAISVFESSAKVGRSILRSGNGRCNITNANIDFEQYHNSDFVRSVEKSALCSCADEQDIFMSHSWYNKAFDNKHVPGADELFFVNRGLLLREESEGRLYPYPNKASVVLDALLRCIDSHIVKLHTDSSVEKIVSHKKDSQKRFAVHLSNKRVEHADVVVIATGGASSFDVLSKVEPELDGLNCTQAMLCPLAINEKIVAKLDNIRARCKVTLVRAGNVIAAESGEVLFRKYGVSGIAIFNLSRYAKKGDKLEIDFLPDLSDSVAANMLQSRYLSMTESLSHTSSEATNADMLAGILLPEVADVVLESSGVSSMSAFQMNEGDKLLACAIKHFTLTVEGPAETDRAQVYRGGLSVDAVDWSTLESRQLPGLYVVGEALDVDGPCGGYNLHFAWTSGLVAAGSISKEYL